MGDETRKSFTRSFIDSFNSFRESPFASFTLDPMEEVNPALLFDCLPASSFLPSFNEYSLINASWMTWKIRKENWEWERVFVCEREREREMDRWKEDVTDNNKRWMPVREWEQERKNQEREKKEWVVGINEFFWAFFSPSVETRLIMRCSLLSLINGKSKWILMIMSVCLREKFEREKKWLCYPPLISFSPFSLEGSLSLALKNVPSVILMI